MSEPEDIQKVARALLKVPETNLLLIELARDVVTEDGELDIDRLSEIPKEVNLAVAQAQAYTKGTDRARQALKPLQARAGES
ncbi:hypothetical protein LCGC14_1536830 [marine sediment metagenome]|uniref:Uncharacterized protein n=1 Tax=marine sediment metagenome TaxID=412755 RepID=A0A0F9IUA2_9ZZZZ